MNTSRACTGDHHDMCDSPRNCTCGCHWLSPLVRGEVDQAVSPSGRVWVRT
jgi:hypothetical protein